MAPKFAILLSENQTRRVTEVVEHVDLVLLERTLFDLPRAAAAGRWLGQLRHTSPNAELVPYVWHLVSHGNDDGLRDLGSRTLSGPPQAFGLLQDTPQVQQAWEGLMQCIGALEATRVVLRTPTSVTPGPVGRKRLETWVAARKAEKLNVLWEPEGLWQADEATNLSTILGIDVLGRAFAAGRPNYSELEPELLFHPGAWLRVDGMGKRPRLSADQLDALLEHCEVQPDTTMVFAGPKAIGNFKATRAEMV